MNLDTALSMFGYSFNDSVDEKQLKIDYRKLSKLYHPDCVKTGSEEKFKQLKSAYKILSIWLCDKCKGKTSIVRFDIGELECTRGAREIRDITGRLYERQFILGKDAYIVFEPTVTIDGVTNSYIVVSSYNMTGTYELYVEFEVEDYETVKNVCVELCGERRTITGCKGIRAFEVDMRVGLSKVKVRLVIKKIVKEISNEYIVCSADELGN